MIARAPGKVVISGAYAVLEGAPSVVAAVDRYVTADTSRPPPFTTPEVRAALGDRSAPWFDASALRAGDKKLGLGSSAAILVASLAAVEAEAERGIASDEDLRSAVLEPAILAHRKAQGGGSGVDVAASTYGGLIVATKWGERLDVRPSAVPTELTVEVLFAGTPASTPELVGRVKAFKAAARSEYEDILTELTAAARDAVAAFDAASPSRVVLALRAQLRGLSALGARAGAPIVTAEVAELADHAAREGAVVLPAGAGGGDVALYVGIRSSSPSMRREFEAAHHELLDLEIGARGVHLVRA